MPTNEEHMEVAVYYDTKDDLALAERILKEHDPTQQVRVYDGVVEGRVSRQKCSELRKKGLLVDSLRPQMALDQEFDEAAYSDDAQLAEAFDEVEPQPTLASDTFTTLDVLEAPARRSARKLRAPRFKRSARSDPSLKRQLERFREKAHSEAAGEIKSRAQGSERTPRQRRATQTSWNVRRSASASEAMSGENVADFTEPVTGGGGEEAATAISSATAEAESSEDVYNVKLRGPILPEWRVALVQEGLEVTSFEPPNTYRMFLSDQQVALVEAFPFVAAVERYSLADTVTPDLLNALEAAEQITRPVADDPTAALAPEIFSSTVAPASLPETFEVICHRSEDRPAVSRVIEEEGAEIVDQAYDTIRFKAAIESPLLAALADLPEVRKVAPYRPRSLFSNFCRTLIGINAVSEGAGEQYTGEGEVIGIFDSGIDQNHPDFVGRVKEAVSFRNASHVDEVGHGTHVAGIIAGTGAASDDEKICGVAPGAELVVVGILKADKTLDLPVDLGELLSEAVQRGAKIINLSWGTAIGGSYDQGSASVDKFIYENPNILVVVAAGNSGIAPEGFVTYNSIGTPASAKNVLTVGACATDRSGINNTWGTFRPALFQRPPTSNMATAGNPDLPAAISSRGPTDFDSVKPDLLAPGTFVLAPRASHFFQGLAWEDYPKHNNSYTFIGGTSMAAPVVTGAAAVLREYLRKVLGTEDPSAALLKGILIASAKRLPPLRPEMEATVGYPDFDQGYGRLDLRNILPHPGAPPTRKFAFVDIANDAPEALQSRMPVGAPRKSSRTYTVRVKNGSAQPLTVVLAWTDWPGNGVQNNLQLDVRGPGGVATVGNPQHRFRRDPLFDDASAEGLAFDKRNNVEVVSIDPHTTALPGVVYRIRVVAQNTAFPPQGYAICVCGELDSELTVE